MNIDHLITPYKLGRPVLTGSGRKGSFDEKAVDCPMVFSHRGRFMMLYIGFDGIGYQTALAESDDLIHWIHKGVILSRGSARGWDSVGMAGTALLMDKDLYGGNRLLKWQDKYWLMYHAYPAEGYEAGSAQVGLAWTQDEELLDWHCMQAPVFSWKDGAAWERGGLYKTDLVCHNGKFYMFYNAKDKDERGWKEQIGMAVSDDLIHWERPFDHPVVPVTEGAWDSSFAADPQVFYDSKENQWVMFYYGLGNLSACDGLAVSSDLQHWKKFPAPILTTGRRGQIDSSYAHKPGIIFHEGALYHFYCACRPYISGDVTDNRGEFRCISMARSKKWAEM